MGIYLADQTQVFLQAILTGAALGLLFDLFRISRIAIPMRSTVVFLEDMIFWAICAVVTFLLMLSAMEGMLRWFLLIGELLGALVYNLTLGRLVMSVSRTIIRVVQAILRFLLRWLLRPIWWIFYRLVALLLHPLFILIRMAKKSAHRCKFRLKVRRILLYNHFMDHMPGHRKSPEDIAGDEKGKKDA